MNELSPEQWAHVRSLAERFGASFPEQAPAWRTVGREAEYPVVWPDGSAADVTDLWDDLAGSELTPLRESEQLVVGLEGEHYSYALEVGWGTIEVITGPCEDLHGLSRVHEDAVQRLVRVAEAHGRHVLGYGIQPRTPASVELMSPKHRYGVLLEAMGEGWLWFTQTASDQVHVDVGRQEVVAAANLGNLLAPVTIALTANSPVHEDQSGRACSLREEGMGTIEAVDHRHGMPDTPWRDLEDMVGRLARQRLFMDRIGGQLVATDGCFLDHLERLGGGASQAAWESFLLHEHYAWNSARPRSAQGTVELRAACQQPWSGHMSAAALGLALVEAGPSLRRFLTEVLGPQAWPTLFLWHHQVALDGLAAPEPVPGLLQGILDQCRQALLGRGRGEECFLEPLQARLDARENPAQVARRAYLDGGMAGLVAHARIPAVGG